ncbi:unnamed protein product [Symbiodinium microadriaticum]|nr:unnamed protein product [Symbiodinium microadriaticum]CAE7389689.1 unnamed protein product [Symbiodinium sp. KB8]
MRAEDDEVLVTRAMWCSLVAKAARRFYEETPAFVMFEGTKLMGYMRRAEQLVQPTGLQRSWRAFVDTMSLEEQYGTVVTNLDYEKKEMSTSNSLGRWTEEFKGGTMRAVTKWMWNPETRQRTEWMAKMDAGPFLSALSNKALEQRKVHVRNNRMPYNRKGKTCVESSGTGRRHMKIKTPTAYCMSLNVCGPFRSKGKDPDHADYRFALVVQQEGAVSMDGGDFVPEVDEDEGVGLGPLQGWTEGELLAEGPEQPQGDDCDLPVGMSEEEFKKVFFEVEGIEGYQVMYMAQPSRSRTTRDVLAAVQDAYLRLRAQGFPISRVHADRARELRSDPLRRWLLDRGTYVTYTEGQSPQAKGRAEAAVKYAKTQTKRLLQTGNFAPKLWPMAMRYAMWAQMQRQIHPTKVLIPFGTKVHVKKKVYGVGGKFDLQSRWGQGYYMGPSADVNEGSVVMMEKGNFITTNHMWPGLIDADREAELEEYQAIISTPDRRLRRKSTLNPADYEGVEAMPKSDMNDDSKENLLYDPNHPAEEFARAALKENVIIRDYVETLAGLLPHDAPKPKRFGTQEEDEMMWSSGAYVFSGMVGVSVNARLFPRTTRVCCEYLKSQCPEARFNSIAVFRNIKAKKHQDARNVGMNVAVPLSDFKGTNIVVKRRGKKVMLKEQAGYWWDNYSVRDSAKLKDEEASYLELAMMMKAEVKGNSGAKSKDDMERAYRLRDLLEEEEIMAEQSKRLGANVRSELEDTRDYVVKYLEEVLKQLMQFQDLRDGIFLKAARAPGQEVEHVDYETMLDELEGDLDIIHTVPLEQVKAVLEKWSQAIDKEVQSLFDSGTKVTQGEAKSLERSGGLRIVPSKCIFTLKPPTKPGQKCRRKCRLVICGNYIQKGAAGDQMDLYASGTSTEALRLALTLAAARQWLAAIADVTSAFLMAEWPPNLPKYGLTPPKVVRDAGHAGQDLGGSTSAISLLLLVSLLLL